MTKLTNDQIRQKVRGHYHKVAVKKTEAPFLLHTS